MGPGRGALRRSGGGGPLAEHRGEREPGAPGLRRGRRALLGGGHDRGLRGGAGWRDNPTAYAFTYLWTARSLYYWWRDEGKAVEIPISPCYLNIINPASIALGEGSLSNTLDVINDVFDKVPGIGSITECLSAPIDEPEWPPPGIRD